MRSYLPKGLAAALRGHLGQRSGNVAVERAQVSTSRCVPRCVHTTVAKKVIISYTNRAESTIDVENNTHKWTRTNSDVPLLLLPTHKSHADYLLLSWICLR